MEHSEQILIKWQRPFFTIWTGQAFSLLGSGLVQFALVWWLTLETGSATVLAVATLFAVLPTVLLGPIAGPLVDRWNRRLILIVADGIIALATLWLIYVFSIGAMEVWHVYAVMVIRAAAGAFHFPTMQASTSLMVPKEHLSRVAGLNQTIQGVIGILAPPAGALLIALFTLPVILAIDIFSALLAIVPLFFIPIPQPPRRVVSTSSEDKPSFREDLMEGLRYVWNWPGLLAIVIMAMAINFLLTPAASLMPLLVRNEFGGGVELLAGVQTLLGIGIIVGGVILSVWGGFRRRILTSLMGLIGLGASIIAFGLTPSSAIWIALLAMFVMGAMQSLTNGPIMAVLQSMVAPDMQGRVLSLLGSLAIGMTPLSLIVAGPIADAFGIRVWYVVGGVICLLMGIAGFFIPAVVHMEDQRNENEAETTTVEEQVASAPELAPEISAAVQE